MVKTEEILRFEQNVDKSGNNPETGLNSGKEDYYISFEKKTIKSVKKYG